MPHGNQLVIAAVQAEAEVCLDLIVHRQLHAHRRLRELRLGRGRGQEQEAPSRGRGRGDLLGQLGHAVAEARPRGRAVAGRGRGLRRRLRAGRGQRHVQVKGQRAVHVAALYGRVQRLDVRHRNQRRLGLDLAQRVDQKRLQRARAGQICRKLDGIDHGAGIFQIVGIVLPLDAAVVRAAPDIAGPGDLAAVGRGVIALGIRTRRRDAHHAGGGRNGLGDVLILGIIALEHLIGGGVGHVPVPARRCGLAPQGVGAGGHGLGLQRLQREGIAHLVGHHAQQIVLHRDGQHRPQRAVLRRDGQIAHVKVAGLGFGDVQAVFAVGGVPRQRERLAHADAQTADREPDFAAVDAQRRLRAAVEADGPVAVHGVIARQRQMQRLFALHGAQEHAQHAVVLPGRFGHGQRRRFGQRTEGQKGRRGQRRQHPFEKSKHEILLE